MTIGGQIREWRRQKGVTQKQAGELLGMSAGTYQKYEMDERKPGADALEAFVNAGVNINWLVAGKGPMLLSELTQAKQDTAPVPNSPIDYTLLRDLIEMLERALDTRNLMLEPPRKAATIQLMYEYCKLDTETTVPEMVDRILKLVA